jgi:hypothetical protein
MALTIAAKKASNKLYCELMHDSAEVSSKVFYSSQKLCNNINLKADSTELLESN